MWKCRFITEIILLTFAAWPAGFAVAASAKPERVDPVTEELFKRVNPAIIKITVKKHGIPVSIGTGFFISKDGLLATNHHVMRPALAALIEPKGAASGVSVEFQLADQRVLTDYTVGNCGDSRGLDLCILKLTIAPMFFFEPKAYDPRIGEDISLIGHPRGFDFSLSKGTVAELSKSPTGVSEVQLTATINPGNSGSPIFNGKGVLIGIASRYATEGAGRNFGIQADEIAKMIAKPLKFLPPIDAQKIVAARMTEESKTAMKKVIQPVLKTILENNSGTANTKQYSFKSFKNFDFQFGDQKVSTQLPEGFERCTKLQDDPKQTAYACYGLGGSTVFSVQRSTSTLGLIKKNGTVLKEPLAHPIIEALREEGTWANLEKTLSADQKQTFYSMPTKANCQNLRSNKMPDAMFSETPACRFTVDNDVESGSRSINIWVEKAPYIYSFSVWMNDPTLTDLMSQIPSIAVLTAHVTPAPVLQGSSDETSVVTKRAVASAVVTVDHPSNLYDLKIPTSMGFIRGEMNSNDRGTQNAIQTDYYGKRKPIDRFEDDYHFNVVSVRESALPPQFDEIARTKIEQVAANSGLRLKEKTNEMEPGSVNGTPSRMITAFAKGRGDREMLILANVVFTDAQIFVVYQISDASDPSASFKEFKILASTFKRK